MREGLILLENRIIGSIDIEILEEDDHEPPMGAYKEMPSDIDSGEAEDKGPTFRPGTGPGSERHRAREHHRLPIFRGRGTAGKHKHIQPHYIKTDGTKEKTYKPGESPHRPGPVFRPRIGPGIVPAAKPEKMTVEDVHSALEGLKKGPEFLKAQRASRMAAVKNNPAVLDELHRLVWAEARGSGEAGQKAMLEALFNRSIMVGNTIEEEMHSGFYGPIKHGHMPRSISEREHAEYQRALDAVGEGSNLIHGRTDQGSGADPNVHGPGRVPVPGTAEVFNFWMGDRRGRHFSHEDSQRFAEQQERYYQEGWSGGGPPIGREHLPADPNYQTEAQTAAGRTADRALPANIINQARRVALESGPGELERFMREQGYPRAGNWCGEFAADVIRSVGGTPPANPEVASNWRNWGTPTNSPVPGDVAVARWGGWPTGHTGSHVTFVESIDPEHGTFVGVGGNQGSHARGTFRINSFDFRHGSGEANTAERAGTNLPQFRLKHDISTEGMRPSTNIEDVRGQSPAAQSQRFSPSGPQYDFGGEKFGIEAADMPWAMRTRPEQLREIRSGRILSELANPVTRNLLLSSTMAEVGSQGPHAQQAYMEVVINRAVARGETLEQTLHNPAYYPPRTKGLLSKPLSDVEQGRALMTLSEVMKGSNISKMATGNFSGPPSHFKEGPFGIGGIQTAPAPTPPEPPKPVPSPTIAALRPRKL